MRIERAEDVLEYLQAAAFLDKTPSIALTSLGAYVGRDPELPLSIREIANASDAAFASVLEVYHCAFPGGLSELSPEGLRNVLNRPARDDCRYHLWAAQAAPATPIEGVASFFTFPLAGFGGYVALIDGLRATGRFPLLLARIEEQMLRDGGHARGWYIECVPTHEDLFRKMGFLAVDVDYWQPPLDGGADEANAPVLCLMYKEFGRQFARPVLAVPDLLVSVRHIFRHVYQIAAPDSSAFYRQIESQVAALPAAAVRFR